MKRYEKNMQTRRKIIDSAILEFGEKSYGEASVNTICSTGNISKGIIYHYFKDKDELYLNCVRECFDALTDYLGTVVTVDGLSAEGAMEGYFDARIAFFEAHPSYLGIFCGAVTNPPVHLSAAVDEITAGFNAQTVWIMTALLGKVKLRPDVTLEEVIEVFREYQDFVNVRIQMRTSGKSTLEEHEKRCRRSLQILLYGVIEREVPKL